MKSVRIRSLSGDYFPAFGMNRRDTPCLRFSAYLVQMRENEDQKNSEYGYFLRSVHLGHQSNVIK